MDTVTSVANNLAILYGTNTVAGLGFNGFMYAQPITDVTMRLLSSIYLGVI